MFFNISNHPAHAERTTWTPEQIAEANDIAGEVIDIPFPVVKPDMSDETIAQIAKGVALDVRGMANGQPAAAMVAGEYVTTIRLIAELQKFGIECYFGQSERVAEEREENGKLVVVHVFQFRGFRKAPAIQLV